MTRDAFANQNTEFAVPARDNRCEFTAFFATHFRDCECTETFLNSITHAVHERVALFGRDSKRIREIGASEPLTNR